MNNPLFNLFNTNGSYPNLMREFTNFRNSFRGDPKQQVQNLLNSGQMTQNQYNELQNAARQFMQMFRL